MSSGDLTFCEWLEGLGLEEETVRWYCHYYETLGFEGGFSVPVLPCNSWALKAARHYSNYLLERGALSIEGYARLRLELQARERLCKRRAQRPQGAYRCPDRPRPPDRRTRYWWLTLALAESGVRLKQLWRAARSGLEPGIVESPVGPLAVLDVLPLGMGYKRVNIIVMRAYTWHRARKLLEGSGYRSITSYYKKKGWTPPSCYRKLHWNLCLAASGGDRSMCEFLQGRSQPVSIVHYEAYKRTGVELQARVIPLVEQALASGLSAVVDRLQYEDPPLRVKSPPDRHPRPEPEQPREPRGYGNPEAAPALAPIVEYLDLLAKRLL